MTKTVEEITALRDAIKEEIGRLPPRNVFGYDNAQDIHDGESYVQDLDRVLEGKSAIGEEVPSWIDGDDDYLLGDWAG